MFSMSFGGVTLRGLVTRVTPPKGGVSRVTTAMLPPQYASGGCRPRSDKPRLAACHDYFPLLLKRMDRSDPRTMLEPMLAVGRRWRALLDLIEASATGRHPLASSGQESAFGRAPRLSVYGRKALPVNFRLLDEEDMQKEL
jgi:hypothetical protein